MEEESVRLQTQGGGSAWTERCEGPCDAAFKEQEVTGSPVKAGVELTADSNRPAVEVFRSSESPVKAGAECTTHAAENLSLGVGHEDFHSGLSTVKAVLEGTKLEGQWTFETVREFEIKCEFFQVFQLKLISSHAFNKLCSGVAVFQPTVAQLGVSLMQLLLVSPRDGRQIGNWLLDQLTHSSTSPTRVRNLLPLPLPCAGAALKLVRKFAVCKTGLLDASRLERSGSKKLRRQQQRKLIHEGCKQLWRCICVVVLNGLGDNWEFQVKSKYNPSEPQQLALKNIDFWVERFCDNPSNSHKIPNFEELVRSKSLDYSGDEVSHALPLRLEELLPGLPEPGIAGTLKAVEAAQGKIRDWVLDPSLTLKDKDSWPESPPRAKINATKEEWYRLCEELYKRGIVEPIPLEQVFRAGDVPVLNGAFAVLKKGKPAVGQSRVTRLIMNLVPANSYQKLMAGDLSTLSSSTSWTQLILPSNGVLLWNGDDQRGAFYAWELPRSWRPFMTFAWPIPGHLVNSKKPWEYVASRVIAMGWVQAVSLFQHLHRQLGMAPRPIGAGHDPSMEWRKDMPAPQSSDGRFEEFVQFYLDDFDCPEIVSSDGWEKLQGKLSATHQRQRDAYKKWNVGIAVDKAHVREPQVIRMGAEVDGVAGTIGAPLDKRVEVAFLGIWAMGLRLPPNKILLMVLGRLVRCFEFRRPLMALLNDVWPKGHVDMRRPWSMKSCQEILRAIALLPLAAVSMRTQISNMATCSDASEAGGGLCASGGLTSEGELLLQHLDSEEYRSTRCFPFQPQGAMPTGTRTGPRIVVISLFDGIAALMVALCRLDCQVVAFAASEIDKDCKKLVRRRWPGVMELGDVSKIDRTILEALGQSINHQVDLVLCGGGSPCQDLSALLANRAGLEGSRSKLFFEMPRIFALLKEVFHCPVHTFVENVFSMTHDNRAAFSEALGIEPILLDCIQFTECRRPRLYWLSWNIEPLGHECLLQHDGYKEWQMPYLVVTPGWWVDSLCARVGTQPLPTLTRALPRQNPPRQAAGIQDASDKAKQRWQQDSHRFQVYFYEDRNLIQRPDGQLRLPSLSEKECVMGFPKGYVSEGLDPKLTMNEAFNLGSCMIGNSFNVFAMGFLLDELLRQVGPSHVPRQLAKILATADTAPSGWCTSPSFVPQCVPDHASQRLIHEFLRHGDRGGSDVRLDLGIPFRAKAWPRTGIRSRLFHWRIIHGYRWSHPAHINVLEMQAVVNSLQCRLRSTKRFNQRVLHLVDNQVCASVISKGRSSSFRLRKALNKLSALCLAGGLMVSVGYIATHDNPSDFPSRWASKPAKLKHTVKPASCKDKVRNLPTK